ncbi:MAG: hypothetical protein OIN86_13055 [Candidatus Methanoperedens sp.]|nr:hypothetical protein [Candidatus Methanoperedens sp.]CAG0948909.1 hypothetical protein METP1_00066 [Methanosarcinales archaeon]
MKLSDTTNINLSKEVKAELENRKKSLGKRIGRVVSYDDLLRVMIGWSI